MDADAFQQLFDGFNATNETLVCFCDCTVDYSGRAESHLPRGDRILIFKADNTLLIHQPTNNEPINYMKAGTTFTVDHDDDLVIHANHTGLKEYMDITIHTIYDTMRGTLSDGQALEIVGTEEDMSDMIKEQ
ncbi:MAG: hypothetical protein ABEI52_00610, partial [Halobacteriaceae archaeon]